MGGRESFMKILGFALKKTSIRKKIVLSISCVAILMAFYCVAFSYWLTTSKVEDMSRRLSENNLHSAGKLVDNYLNLFENYTTQIVRIPDLQKINESGRFPLDDTLNTDSIHSAVRTYLSMAESDGIKFGECAIYLKNGYSYIYSNQPNPFYNDYESCLLYFQKQGFDDFQYNQAEWISNTTLYNENGEETIGLINVRFFYNSITMEKTGIIVSTLYEDNLREVYSGFAENAFILSKKGIVLSSAEKNKIAALYPDETIRLSILNSSGNGTLTYKKNWYQNPEMVSFRAVMNNDAYLVVPFDFYTVMTRKEMVEYIRSSLFPMSAGVLIAFLLAFLFSDRLSKSIVTLTTFVKHIEEGHNKGRIHLEGRDEVAYLGEKINDMLNRIQESEMNREQELKNEANAGIAAAAVPNQSSSPV